MGGNLVPGDTNDAPDVFVRDRRTGTTARVSVSSAGAQASGTSSHAVISADGRYVAFDSDASDLVPNDSDLVANAFVHDRTTGVTELIPESRAFSSILGPSISGDGRFVAHLRGFSVWVYDRATGTSGQVSVDNNGGPGDGINALPSISFDGRYVAFVTTAGFDPDDTNGTLDVYLRDRRNRRTQRISLNAKNEDGDDISTAGSISADGRYVSFSSFNTLVPDDTGTTNDVFLRFALAPRPLATTGSTTIARGTTGQITITGTWLDPSALQILVDSPDGATVDAIAVQDPNTTAVLTISVAADATTGSRDIVAANPGNAWNVTAGAVDRCMSCLTVS